MSFVTLAIRLLREFYENIRFKKILSGFLSVNSGNRSELPLILFWDLGGFPAILAKNAIFSIALKLRGYGAHCVICDGSPDACIQRGLEQNEQIELWQERCSGCLARMKNMAARYCLDYSFVGDYVDVSQRDEFRQLSRSIPIRDILAYEYYGIKVGELAWSSTNRYMKGYIVDQLELRQEDEIIYRKYFYAALINSCAASEVIQKRQPAGIVTSHGVYVDYGPPVSIGYSKGVNVMTWASGFADFMHYFTIPKAASKLELRGITLLEWQKRVAQPLSEEENHLLDEFIHNRYFKAMARDISILSSPEDPSVLKKTLGIDNGKPIICLFTHINWDACFDLSTMIFDTANQWVVESINKMIQLPEVNWVIRVHPGEKTDGSLFTTDDVIMRKFQSLPDHIKVIWSDSAINSYGIYQLIDGGITIFGTCGVELSLLGKPVVVAGNAHFSGKGFSVDAESRERYFSILEDISCFTSLTEEQILLARQYAYSYFIQRQIPIKVIDSAQGHWGDLDLSRLGDLLPGHDPVMDAICDGIVNSRDVIMDREMLKTCSGRY